MKGLKKVVSGLVATVIAMSSLVPSVGAEDDTTKAEIEFSLKYLDSLPKKGEENFDEFLKLPDINKLKENREDPVKHKDGSIENVKINEKNIYDQINGKVKKLTKNVDDSTPKSGMTEDEIEDGIENGKISQYYKLPRNWRIADEIYRWVASNIEYDYESIEKDENGKESFRKPQDAVFVFAYDKKGKGVCEGKANLVNLMMRMAGIPSLLVTSIEDSDGESHAYNAIYLEEDNNPNRTGWTLLDSTDTDAMSIENAFPAFYNEKLTFKQANKNIIIDPGHRISEVIVDYVDDDYSNNLMYKVDGVNYELRGKEGDAFIYLDSDDDGKLVKNVSILPDMVKLGMKFKIGKGIKSLNLKGDEIIDVSEAKDLDTIDISQSNMYMAENGVIYEKNIYGSKDKELFVPKNVKVLGEKVRIIDKKNQEKLKKLNEKFLNKFDEYYKYLAFNSDGGFLSYQKIQECSTMSNKFKEAYNGIYDNPTDDNLKMFEESLNRFIKYSKESIEAVKAQTGCIAF